MNNREQFYPTPQKLIEKMTRHITWSEVRDVLEPSAGDGRVVDYIKQYECVHREIEVDMVEINPTLRNVLKGKGYHVVADDFLTFHTFKKYDLIIMNPPFADGHKHLLHAMELMRYGGRIICVLNAETIKNPYSNSRRDLVDKLDELDASVEYFQEVFVNADVPTDVEVALIEIEMPLKQSTVITDDLREKWFPRCDEEQLCTELVEGDVIKQLIARYNMEVECGVRLIEEYHAMLPYISNGGNSYNYPLIELKICGEDGKTVNDYIRSIRRKYWTALFEDKDVTGILPSKQIEEYRNSVRELQDYDFTYYNIKTLQEQMSRTLVQNIEQTIVDLFETLTSKYSYYPECEKNVHYFNGWCTNKAWIVNKKVVLPISGYDMTWGYYPNKYCCVEKIVDLELAMNYLSGIISSESKVAEVLKAAADTNQTKNIETKYFTLTFYKKGTCHIVFKDEELLKKLNIAGCMHKGWLPPAYGKKSYEDFSDEERAVVDSFQGKEEYEKVCEKSDYYISSCVTYAGGLEEKNDFKGIL